MPVLKCGCKDHRGNKAAATYQDATYGPGMRVHTPTKQGEGDGRKYRCTICGNERTGK